MTINTIKRNSIIIAAEAVQKYNVKMFHIYNYGAIGIAMYYSEYSDIEPRWSEYGSLIYLLYQITKERGVYEICKMFHNIGKTAVSQYIWEKYFPKWEYKDASF